MSGSTTDYSAAFRDCLERLDVSLIRKLWRHVRPDLPQPKTDEAALVALHHARTQASSINFKMRAYSHAWLVERSFPSGLPDRLRPSAERMYPRIVRAVGIASSVRSPLLKPISNEIRSAMEQSVLESFADGKGDDDAFVKRRMMEARDATITSFVGARRKV